MPTEDDVRRIALELPGAFEKAAWGMPTFRVERGKVFASIDDSPEGPVLGVKCPQEERAELIATEPEKFFLRAGHDDNYPWLRVRIHALDDRDELAAILADSWRQAAPRKLLEAHPELGAPPQD
ncbi:MmcQ/YjbR family DNA-binding protein [Streptomyces sp. NPDC059009]|uniref:MmcQ/YjbR family DNA-binding protein n=1 Tax=Streptomyces sp. NPDC059009 TaxID=3346694 RepID=UPI0036A4CF1F